MTTENKNAPLQHQIVSQLNVGSYKAARISFVAAIACLVLLAALHIIKPEFEPSWHFVSEYAIGKYGWVMKLSFFSWAISCITLFTAVRSQIRTTGGKIGLALLFIVGISMIIGGLFVMDPTTANKDELTIHGDLHALAGIIGIPGLPVAAMLTSVSLARNNTRAFVKRSLIWSAHFTWISLVLMFAILFITLGKSQGKFGPDVLIGWPNRLLVFAYCMWLMTVARHIMRLRGNK